MMTPTTIASKNFNDVFVAAHYYPDEPASFVLCQWSEQMSLSQLDAMTLANFISNTIETLPRSLRDFRCLDDQPVEPGIYRIIWKDGSESSGCVFVDRQGYSWLAPTNWVSPSRDAWHLVHKLERLRDG